nr:hypothetical protein [Tanacetum cinerariifolium]
LQGQVFCGFPVASRKPECVAVLSAARHRQALAVGRRPAPRSLDLPAREGQIVDFFRGKHRPAIGLLHQSAVRRNEDGQPQCQFAVFDEGGMGDGHRSQYRTGKQEVEGSADVFNHVYYHSYRVLPGADELFFREGLVRSPCRCDELPRTLSFRTAMN